MARTRPFAALRRQLQLALHADARGVPLHETRAHFEQLTHEAAGVALGRRRFMQLSATALTALGTLGAGHALSGCAREDHASDVHVGIVGAGIAGLLCGYRLKQAGVRVSLYDAATRAGGRMLSARGKLAEGQLAELGGELIDTGHYTLRRLAKELGLALDEVKDYPADTRADTYFFGGKNVLPSVLAESFRPLAAQMQKDVKAAAKNKDAFAHLDAMSIAEYLSSVPDVDPVLAQVIKVAYIGEFGRELEEQSAFNLLSMIDAGTPDPFRIFGDSDERYHTHLGNDAFPNKLAGKLQAELELDRRLVRVKKLATGKLQLTLDRSGSSIEATFDKVVLALPFTMLRSVELDAELPSDKQTMIQTLGYGTNAKVIGQFSSRIWLEQDHASGSAFTEGSPQCLWDTSRKQAGKSGVLTVFLGGQAGLASGAGSAEDRMRAFLPDIDAVFPGAQAAYKDGSALRMHWPSAPFCLGSYACYLPGQAGWSGSEGAKVGNLHFCGEHTSASFQGYMEGAAESGERAADEIFEAIGLTQRTTHARSFVA